jgi:fructoselysine-6-P-deglycase FrlB-like protein
VAHPERRAVTAPSLSALSAAPESEQNERGYYHTLREILQQPATWPETAELVRRSGLTLVDREGPILLTGSGSSHYIGESLEPILSKTLRAPVRAVPAGSLLTDARSYLPATSAPGTLVSFARSGDSPESCAVVDLFLETEPRWRHVILTCNGRGGLATRYRDRPNVSVVVLADRTNDRSLVMTSSFTNLWLAGRIAGGGSPDVGALAAAAKNVLEHDDVLRQAVDSGLQNAVFLGSGGRAGAAREGALKMLEMTDGRVPTFAETFLGLRHGPMCAVRDETLLAALLSSSPPARAYELDVLGEIEDKGIRPRRLLVGPGGDIPFEVHDDDSPVLGVVVTQILGFLRSVSIGLRPDAPSAGGVISRVVRKFEIHRS